MLPGEREGQHFVGLPKVWEPIRDPGPRITRVREPGDVGVFECDSASFELRERGLDELHCERPFTPHPGWRGHVEREVR